jgi:hypothetical protein
MAIRRPMTRCRQRSHAASRERAAAARGVETAPTLPQPARQDDLRNANGLARYFG